MTVSYLEAIFGGAARQRTELHLIAVVTACRLNRIIHHDPTAGK